MKKNQVKNFDTGNMLRWQIKNSAINAAQVSRIMRRYPATINRLLKRTSIQSSILWEFCEAVNYNFFADLAGRLPAEMPHNNAHIAELKKQIQELKAERDTLQKVVDILTKKG